MQTNFSATQLADPDMNASEKILRSCVHCGFCQATCPTYVLLGDELDSPRGRIYLMKEMLENNRPATATDVKPVSYTHLDVYKRQHVNSLLMTRRGSQGVGRCQI